ncbi:hypothetical protein M0R45_009389 [Rubus argutus]|uniref:Uncharacterized protein n=1 Tax=Rubus argutus TaxID=59490 RepID=A0AAW1Y3W2_RUBAR
MLKSWNCSQIGNVHSWVNESRNALDDIQLEISTHGPSVDRFKRETSAESQFLLDLSLQSTLLRDKARVHWLKDGDRNTSFLHNMIKIRRLNKSISSLTVARECCSSGS